MNNTTIAIHCRECGTAWYQRRDWKFRPATTIENATEPRITIAKTLTECTQHRDTGAQPPPVVNHPGNDDFSVNTQRNKAKLSYRSVTDSRE